MFSTLGLLTGASSTTGSAGVASSAFSTIVTGSALGASSSTGASGAGFSSITSSFTSTGFTSSFLGSSAAGFALGFLFRLSKSILPTCLNCTGAETSIFTSSGSSLTASIVTTSFLDFSL